MHNNYSNSVIHLLAFVVTVSLTPLSASTIIGSATNKSSSTPAYIEKRYYPASHPKLLFTINYYSPTGDQFSHKKLYKAKSLWRPDFTIENSNLGHTLSVSVNNDTVITTVKQGDTIDTTKKVFKPNWVWDAGVHYWIVDNWEQLSKKTTLTLYVPENNMIVNFSAQKKKRDSLYTVTLTPNNWFINMFLDDIIIVYDKDMNIISYNGLSDVKDTNGKNFNVHIKYHSNREN